MEQALMESVETLLKSVRHLKGKARLNKLHTALEAAKAVAKLRVLESYSIQFGGSAASNYDINTEDPRFDDGREAWNSVGFNGQVPYLQHQPLTIRVYDEARRVGRALHRQNLYAGGAHKNRVDYLVGPGIGWKLVAHDKEAEDDALTLQANNALQAFQKQSDWLLRERDMVLRCDRDGESFQRLYLNADGPLKVRWIEPERVRPPASSTHAAPFGVEPDKKDAETVKAYWVLEGDDAIPTRVLAEQSATKHVDGGIPHIVHAKSNVDQSWPRGWPMLWAAREALITCDKITQAMATVAAIQSKIAMIRKHESATSSEIDSWLADNDDMSVSNTLTGKTTHYTGLEDGTVFDAANVSYQAPISSVNAANNLPTVEILLRSVAASLNMPEFVFSGRMDGGFADSLVGETPFIKHIIAEHALLGLPLAKVLWASVQHEVFWGRLPKSVLEDYRLQASYPDPQIRQPLPMAQTRQIQHASGVMSTRTWQEHAGLDPDIEERNQAGEEPDEPEDSDDAPGFGEKPPAGQGPDGPGGADMKGNGDPMTSTSPVAFSSEEGLRESDILEALVGGDHMGVLAMLLQQVARLGIKLSPEDVLKLQIVGTLQNEALPATLRIQAVLRAMLGGDHAATDGGDAGGEVIPGTGI